MTGTNEKASLFLLPTADTESPSPSPALLTSPLVSKTLHQSLTPVPALIYLYSLGVKPSVTRPVSNDVSHLTNVC